jgi:hypothetical protein
MSDDTGSIWICTEIWHHPLFVVLNTSANDGQIVFIATLSAADYPSGEVDYEKLTRYTRIPRSELDRFLADFVKHGLVEVRDGKHFVMRHDDMYILDPNFIPPDDPDDNEAL